MGCKNIESDDQGGLRVSLQRDSGLPTITEIYLNNKFTYYLLTTYFVLGIGLNSNVFHLTLIKTLLSGSATPQTDKDVL